VNHPTRYLPTEAIISVTNRCDARCSMCNIWRLERREVLGPEDYRRGLPATLRNVNLTGGEALLRPDIVEIAQAIYEASGRPRIILATNGFRTERTLQTVALILQHVPNLGMAVSIDGDAETHDRMRGVPHAYDRAVKTLRGLRELGIRDIRIGFTATPANVDQLMSVYRLANELGVQFAATVAQNSDVYYATDENQAIGAEAVARHFGDLVKARLGSPAPKNWLRAYFDHGAIHFATTGFRMTGCDAASGFFYLAPTGDVHPCLTLPTVLGNLREAPFEVLWHGQEALRAREEARSCRKCWMMCTARTELKRHPVAIGWWVGRNQAKALGQAGRQRLRRSAGANSA
jgi:MoaA/NifB/PqqE/SkfB family radical SAM enzyme